MDLRAGLVGRGQERFVGAEVSVEFEDVYRSCIAERIGFALFQCEDEGGRVPVS